MTIPSRPAPPPPNPNRSQVVSSHINPNYGSASTTTQATRCANKKPAPPRPPPPKMQAPAPVKKSGSQKSISILSNLFGSKNHNKSVDKLSHTSSEQRIPPKIPAPPVFNTMKPQPSTPPAPKAKSDVQLINFDESPTWSPPTIKKSNTGSDSVSMDSFCSSNSSPNNLGCGSGAMSQTESGFEDDFSVSDFKVTSGATSRSTTFSNDPFDCLEDFGGSAKAATNVQSNIRNVKPLIQPKPQSVGSANFYTSTGSIVPSTAAATYDDSLSNGRTLMKAPTLSMPTIIKPMGSKGKVSPMNVEIKKTAPVLNREPSDESYDDEMPSLPMPSIPPPPPPVLDELDDDPETNSYAIALYDFESDVVEDLNIKANEKVYLLKQMNDEWMLGRNKRGCEGIFPMSYVDIKIPLNQVEPDSGTASRSASVSPAVNSHPVLALYSFNAETAEDLTIKENELVNVMYEINSEWLYGSNMGGDYGQFPSNFIEYIPQGLPQMPK